MKKIYQKVVSVTYGNSSQQTYLTNDIIMKNLRAKIQQWKRQKSTDKYTRINEFSKQFVDAIYDNNFKLAKILIVDGKVDVKIKDDCGNTPLIAVCQQTTLQNQKEAVKLNNSLWQSGSKFHSSNKSGKTAVNYARVMT